MSKLLVVVGATGSQGRAVISWFKQHEPDWKIRGLTRNPSSPAAQGIAQTGVEIVQADLNDVDSLKAAFKGANYIFAYTDFMGITMGPQVMGRFEAGEIQPPIGTASLAIEVQQGKNVADAAGTVPELERLVWSALPDVRRLSKSKYTQAYHFDAKAAVTEYMLQSGALQGKASMVHMSMFVENYAKMDLFKIKKDEDGTAISRTSFGAEVSLPLIDIEKDAGAFVKALIDGPAGVQVLGVSEWLTTTQLLDQWSSVTGIPCRFEQTPDRSFTDNDATGLGIEFLETMKYVGEFGFVEQDPQVLMPEDLEKKGVSIPRTKVDDFLKRVDWEKVLEG